MPSQFKHHYSLDEARALLPQIREWLVALARLQRELAELDASLAPSLSEHRDLGGHTVNAWIREMTAFKALLNEFRSRDIQVKDLERGLIDFPAIVNGREVFLCWEQDEDDIEFWHDLDTGYAGRERL